MTISDVTLGAVVLTTNAIEISKPVPQKITEHRIPGRDGNVFQVMGRDAKSIAISGRITGSSRDTTRSTLEGYRGTTQSYSDGEDSITVLVESVNFPRSGTAPGYLSFTLSLKEFEQG